MKDWFAGLAPRERWIVGVGGVAAALILAYLLAVEPAMEAFAARERRVASLESQVAWMHETAAEVAALRGSGQRIAGDASTGGDRPVYIAIDAALADADLPAPSRLEPTGEDGAARLGFERVAFDPLARLIGELRGEYGLRVTRARIQRLDNGQVSAQMTLER